jgi:hypothetical protein
MTLRIINMTWHVTPNDDLAPHEESTTCSCEPEVLFVDGHMIVVHSSFDGREGVEMAKELLKIKLEDNEEES